MIAFLWLDRHHDRGKSLRGASIALVFWSENRRAGGRE